MPYVRDHIYYVRLNYVKLQHGNHFGLFICNFEAEEVTRFRKKVDLPTWWPLHVVTVPEALKKARSIGGNTKDLRCFSALQEKEKKFCMN